MSLRQELLQTSNRRRRKEIYTRILLGLGGIFLIAAVVVFLFYIPAFRISKISISGLDDASTGELRAQVFGLIRGREFLVIPKDHMAFFPRGEIEKFLSDKYRVRNFSVKKDFPSGLDISITERKTWAIWCSEKNENDCLLLDKDGLAFEKAQALSGSAILKIVDSRESDFLGKNILPNEAFAKIVALQESIAKSTSEEVSKINIIPSGETYKLYLKSGYYLLVDSDTDISRALENLSISLNSGEIRDKRNTLEYIDLRFPDKVFYKFK